MAEFKNPNQQGGGDNKSLLVNDARPGHRLRRPAVLQRSEEDPQPVAPNAITSSQTAAAEDPAPGLACHALDGHDCKRRHCCAHPSSSATAEEHHRHRERTLSHHLLQSPGQIIRLDSEAEARWRRASRTPRAGRLDIVHTRAAEKFGYPLSLTTYDPAMTAALARRCMCRPRPATSPLLRPHYAR